MVKSTFADEFRFSIDSSLRTVAGSSGDAEKRREPGAPKGNRTPVFAVRGRRPGPLDDGGWRPSALFYASAWRGSKVRRFGGEGKPIGRGRFWAGANSYNSLDVRDILFYFCSQCQIDPRGRNRAGDGEVLSLVFLFEIYIATIVVRRLFRVAHACAAASVVTKHPSQRTGADC